MAKAKPTTAAPPKPTEEKPTEEPIKKRERKPLPPLKDAQAEQMKQVEAAGANLLGTINKCAAVPASHLRRYFSDLGTVFRVKMDERRGDPAARKKAQLQERLVKIQSQLAEFDKEETK